MPTRPKFTQPAPAPPESSQETAGGAGDTGTYRRLVYLDDPEPEPLPDDYGSAPVTTLTIPQAPAITEQRMAAYLGVSLPEPDPPGISAQEAARRLDDFRSNRTIIVDVGDMVARFIPGPSPLLTLSRAVRGPSPNQRALDRAARKASSRTWKENLRALRRGSVLLGNNLTREETQSWLGECRAALDRLQELADNAE